MEIPAQEDVDRLAAEAAARPRWYRFKVAAFAAFGYFYIWSVGLGALAVAVGATVLVVSLRTGLLIKLVIPIYFFAGYVLKSLWVQVIPPDGLALERERAPQLFAELDRLGRRLGAPKLHRVLLTSDWNAGISQIPRFGLLGGHRGYLTVGMPYLHALTPDEFRAVLAHELGHLSHAHGRISTWIYRVRLTWSRLVDELERQGSSGFPFRTFLDWFVPRLAASSFVLARQQEYEADRGAAEATSSRAIADSLIRSCLGDSALSSEVWPEFWRKTETQPKPPREGVVGLWSSLGSISARGESETALAAALALATDLADTHPSLKDRLQALGETARVPPVVNESAAEYFLGTESRALTDEVAASWVSEVEEAWFAQHKAAKQARERLAALEARSTEDLTATEQVERAVLLGATADEEVALSLLRDAHAANPESADACFQLGKHLAQRGDPQGFELLRGAIERDPRWELEALSELYQFHKLRGEAEATSAIEKRWERIQLGLKRRDRIDVGSRFDPHDCAPEVIAKISEVAARFPRIRKVYLARRIDPEIPWLPLIVVGFRVAARFRRASFYQEIGSSFARELELPVKAMILPHDIVDGAIARAIERTDGAEIYRRSARR